MSEYSKKSENRSRTPNGRTSASRQAPIADILKAYKRDSLRRNSTQSGIDEGESVPGRVAVIQMKSEHTAGTIQRRALTGGEQEQLAADLIVAREIEAGYNALKEEIILVESAVTCSASDLFTFHLKIDECTTFYDGYFTKLNEYKRSASDSFKTYDRFKRWLNQYVHSGGKNMLLNLKLHMKGLLKKDQGSIKTSSVVRFSDFLELLKKLYAQTVFQCKKRNPLPDLFTLKSDLETLMAEVEKIEDRNLAAIKTLHRQIAWSLEGYPTWNSDLKKLFLELRWVDGKNKLKDADLKEVGTINVASRSDESEGYYMRSQNVHKMHIGKGQVNPFADRVGEYLEEGAKTYNIGGAKMRADTVMVQKELKRGRKKVSSKKVERLRDDILEHKNKYVKFIVDHFGSGIHLKAPSAQVSALYPCVLILFDDNLMGKVNRSQTNIPEFLTHLIAGHINAALQRGGLRPLVDRRQSFGFMTPTITDVHSGVRLSLGIIPSEGWCTAVIQGIKSADSDIELLEQLKPADATDDKFMAYQNFEKDKTGSDPNFVIMNKFNQGSVLGAGHKLISDKLLSEDNKKSITKSELNTIFGVKDGAEVVADIRKVKKRDFSGQKVNEDSIALYSRLASFYEQFIKLSGHPVHPQPVDWEKVDPGEKMQELMDEGGRATYHDSNEVVGLEESSDEEDRDPNRVPSGMSALFLPIASYSSIHKDRSIIYDTAPFSYFEIDGSWKKTFKLDYIERLGVRYPLVTPAFKNKALINFDLGAEQEINAKTQPFHQRIEDIKRQADDDVDKLRSEFQQKTSKIDEEYGRNREIELRKFEEENQPGPGVDQQELSVRLLENTIRIDREISEMKIAAKKKEAEQVEVEIEKVNDRKNKKIEEQDLLIETKKNELKTFFEEQKVVLKSQSDLLGSLMNAYMDCKEDDLREKKEQPSEKLRLAIREMEEVLERLKGVDTADSPGRFVARSILSAFEKVGFDTMYKGAKAKIESNVEVAFVDVNPCMTSEDKFDSGANLYHQTMKKYDKLRMIVVDITSCTEKQVNDLIVLFQNQTVDREGKELVPFMCLAKSGTKHDQIGLDISTMGRCHYIMHPGFADDVGMMIEFKNLKRASRSLSQNTEPLIVKKLRRDLRKAAEISEKK